MKRLRRLVEYCMDFITNTIANFKSEIAAGTKCQTKTK